VRVLTGAAHAIESHRPHHHQARGITARARADARDHAEPADDHAPVQFSPTDSADPFDDRGPRRHSLAERQGRRARRVPIRYDASRRIKLNHPKVRNKDVKRVPNGGQSMASQDETAAPQDWLLAFTASNVRASDGDGRPWGDETAIAQRAYLGANPWDGECEVTPMIGGYLTMNAIRDALERAIADAEAKGRRGVKAGARGHVYICDWQLNALRDLSTENPWGGNPWSKTSRAKKDQTALGLLVRLMSAGVAVRILLWMPSTLEHPGAPDLAEEHWNLAAAVQDHSNTLEGLLKPTQPLGILGLDLRTAAPMAATLHQKMLVVRVGAVDEAFCGGVDLAFTRRDFGLEGTKAVGIGDWQSGETIPISSDGWPKQEPAPAGGYPKYPYRPRGRFSEDLPANVYGQKYRYWHDHHLHLRGPIVATIEQQFTERWIMDANGRAYLFKREETFTGEDDQVKLTSGAAIRPDKTVAPLPIPAPVEPAGEAIVQMWRTIPLRPDIPRGPFAKRGEFTVMAGIAKAVARATQLITIWDQYFWSVPLAQLLAARLRAVPNMKLLIVLPPYGTTHPGDELALRKDAMQALWQGLDEAGRRRVLALDMWGFATGVTQGVGVYVHAKSQTYDDALLVCGSANMNRRSLECDAELDCAVLHTPTVRNQLAALYACVTGATWTNFAPGWLDSWWTAIAKNSARALIEDPFFKQAIGKPKTPNGVEIPYTRSPWIPYDVLEPTSIGPKVQDNVCQFPECKDDPKVKGRLDEITYLLERCHKENSWPWRVPARSLLGDAAAQPEAGEAPAWAEGAEGAAPIARLTL
jgi:phosphatidylserine/phosphatidylglycerophosphate/cardiolipin synthase-like enzyme